MRSNHRNEASIPLTPQGLWLGKVTSINGTDVRVQFERLNRGKPMRATCVESIAPWLTTKTGQDPASTTVWGTATATGTGPGFTGPVFGNPGTPAPSGAVAHYHPHDHLDRLPLAVGDRVVCGWLNGRTDMPIILERVVVAGSGGGTGSATVSTPAADPATPSTPADPATPSNPAQPTTPTATAEPDPAVPSTPSPTTPKSPTAPKNAAGKVVVIDPGHNGKNGQHTAEINKQVDSGNGMKACNTTGTASRSGFTEAEFNWLVAKQLGPILQAHGWQVVYTRSDNSGWGPCVDQRGLTAGRVNAVALLSIHADGNERAGTNGFHVIHPKSLPGHTDKTAPESRKLATAVRDAMLSTSLTASNYAGRAGLDERNDLGTLNRCPVPSMMIECGNMKDSIDVTTMQTAAGQRMIAAAIAQGFEAWWKTQS